MRDDDSMSVSAMTTSSCANDGMDEGFKSAPPSPLPGPSAEPFQFAVPTGGKPSLNVVAGGKPAGKSGKKVCNMVGGGKPLHRVSGKPGAKPKAAGGKPALRVRTRGQQAADRKAEDVMAFSNQHYGTSVTKVIVFVKFVSKTSKSDQNH